MINQYGPYDQEAWIVWSESLVLSCIVGESDGPDGEAGIEQSNGPQGEDGVVRESNGPEGEEGVDGDGDGDGDADADADDDVMDGGDRDKGEDTDESDDGDLVEGGDWEEISGPSLCFLLLIPLSLPLDLSSLLM